MSEPVHTFNIGSAVALMRVGRAVARAGWNGKGMELRLQVPDDHSKMSLPYVYMRTVQGDLVPWLCSQTDLLADDWYVVRDVEPKGGGAPDKEIPF